MEKQFPCSPRFLMSNPNLNSCSLNQWSDEKSANYIQYVNHIMHRDEYEFSHTKCIPSCSRSDFELDITYNRIVESRTFAELSFIYKSGEYRQIEEHYLYDFWSFIPDVGGYLGLLLGYSVLSLYHMLTQWMIDARQWLTNKRQKKWLTKRDEQKV